MAICESCCWRGRNQSDQRTCSHPKARLTQETLGFPRPVYGDVLEDEPCPLLNAVSPQPAVQEKDEQAALL